MKKLILTLIVAIATICGFAQKPRIVENPNYESTNTSSIEFTRIEVNKSETVVSASFWYMHNYWVKICSSCYLKGNNTGKIYKFLRADGIEMDKETFMPISNRLDFKLYFEPVSNEDTSIDFYEGVESKPFEICGISLQPDANLLNGSWEEVGNPGNVVIAFIRDKMLYDGEIWKCNIEKRGNDITINIKATGKTRQLFAVYKKDGILLLKSERKGKGIMLTRKQQAVETAEYAFNPNRATPFFFTPGKVVVKGAVVNKMVDTKEEKLIKVLVYNNFGKETGTPELVTINRNGTFQAELDIPHPQYIWFQEPINSTVFVVPGDTVVMCCDVVEGERSIYTGYAPTVLGNSLSAQLTRWSGLLEQEFEREVGLAELDADNFRKHSATDSTAYAFAEKATPYFATICEQAPDILAKYPLSPIAKDIIVTNVVNNLFIDIMDISSYCEASISLPRYYSFLKDELFRKYILDNNYLFCHRQNWVVFNRFAFDVYYVYYVHFVNDYTNSTFRARPEFEGYETDRELSGVLMQLSYGPHYTAKYNEKIIDAASAVGYDSIPSKGYIYRSALNKIEERLGIGNCMLLQRAMAEIGYDDDVEEMMEDFIGKMPLLTNPLIATNALMKFRKLVAEKEGGAIANQMNPEAAKWLQALNEKYPGEQIIIDFWGLGCAPCRSAMLTHRDLVEKYACKVRFVYVCNEDDNPEDAVTEFFTGNNIKGENLRVSADMWKILSYQFQFTGIPHMEILLKDGTIYKKNGRIFLNDNFISGELLQNK